MNSHVLLGWKNAEIFIRFSDSELVPDRVITIIITNIIIAIRKKFGGILLYLSIVILVTLLGNRTLIRDQEFSRSSFVK